MFSGYRTIQDFYFFLVSFDKLCFKEFVPFACF